MGISTRNGKTYVYCHIHTDVCTLKRAHRDTCICVEGQTNDAWSDCCCAAPAAAAWGRCSTGCCCCLHIDAWYRAQLTFGLKCYFHALVARFKANYDVLLCLPVVRWAKASWPCGPYRNHVSHRRAYVFSEAEPVIRLYMYTYKSYMFKSYKYVVCISTN